MALYRINKKSYKDFLDSSQWAEKRNEVLRKQKECQLCGEKNESGFFPLSVHHIEYKENLLEGPFAVLCEQCHELFRYVALDNGKYLFERIKELLERTCHNICPKKSHK